MLQLLSLITHILIFLQLLPLIPKVLKSIRHVQTKFHFQKLKRLKVMICSLNVSR
jgi:hypothetical protein